MKKKMSVIVLLFLNKNNNIIVIMIIIQQFVIYSVSSSAYISLTEATMVILTIATIIQDVPNRVLSYRAWVPYNHSTSLGFWIAYMHQVIAHAYGASINAAFDTLIPSMMIQICCQFSILQHRFVILPDIIQSSYGDLQKYDDRKLIKLETFHFSKCIDHHLQIYKLSQAELYLFEINIYNLISFYMLPI